jgi:hypothetical protein
MRRSTHHDDHIDVLVIGQNRNVLERVTIDEDHICEVAGLNLA